MWRNSLHNWLIFRSRNRRYDNENRRRVYEYHVRGCDDVRIGSSNNKKDKNPVVRTWSNRNRPYISSPILVTGHNSTCYVDNSQNISLRDLGIHTGYKETQIRDLNAASLTDEADGEALCEYKTQVLW